METRKKSRTSLLRFGALIALSGPAAFISGALNASAQSTPPCVQSSSATPQSAVVRVVDQSGALLPHAAIEIRCGKTVLNAIADDHGEARFQLPPGKYTLLTRMPGFADTVRTADLPAPNGPLDVAMSVGSATDVINVTADTGFVPFASNAGSKTNALLVEVPQSISIVNEAEMNARHVITMNEALRYTPGVQTDQYGFENRFDWLEIRGFPAQTFGIYRDGMRFNSLSGKLDPFELESVEVLKGPSSVLYGEVPPGGLINQVTKRPEAERSTDIAAEFGSFDRRQLDADTTGSFDSNQVWRYRLLGLVRDSGTQVNFTPDNRRLIAPAIEWHPSDRTSVTVLADYQHDHTMWDQFLPAEGTLFTNPNGVIPRSTFLGEPGYDNVTRNQGSIAYTADHLFADGWDIHSNYRYQYIDFKGQTIAGDGLVAGSTTDVARYLFATPNTNRINTVDTRALRRFGTGSNFEQTILFGYDYQRLDQRATSYYLFGVGNLNIFNPVYGQTTIPTGAPYLNNDSILNQNGLYAQDQLKFKHHLVLTVGGRQDFASNTIADFLSSSGDFSRLDDKFTGRVGLAYLFDSGLAPYFAFSTSFLPNAGTYVYDPNTGVADKPAVPSDARQIEGGVKFQPRNWNSFITASLFQINETNVLVPNSSFTDYQTGEVRSRGVELEGVASLAHGLNLHAGYTLASAIDTNDIIPQNIGKWLPQTPRNQVSALADYTMQHGRFTGLGGNFGVRFVGQNAADSANSFFVPNYALLDGSLRFGYRHTLFSVNATNLTDKRYVATCISTAACYYGFERNVIGTAKYRF
jgi:iron complex outermembrane recepter protein